ncbi:NACHT domain-containing NTPase [Novosphingobium sp. AAP83]|uniref:NACHT domain-containing protein n=1 Tax=Novosphingobium sp. AAP83 TaxID=1523425 RepID=UPI000A899070|nr:NACHT domain-containing protein [Novosphingobium sp. AAP83]
MNDADLAKILTAATPATFKIFSEAFSRTSSGLKVAGRKALIGAMSSLQGYSKYLEETHERVATFKSFANPSEPVKILDHFVTTKLQKKKDEVFDHDYIVDLASRRSKIVVSASAGYGKSMLMKLISLHLFENPNGKIPLFCELRHLNRIKSPNIIDYIHLNYKQNSDVNRSSLEKGLENGAFCFILDGFDELNHEIRPIIEDQILTLSSQYPKNSFIVSGRPDERFDSWRSFRTFKILPMAKTQVIELISKLNYDSGTKRRFIEKIKKGGLYETHESFLSTPLLAILMLLTFEENANIPDKIHLFLQQGI